MRRRLVGLPAARREVRRAAASGGRGDEAGDRPPATPARGRRSDSIMEGEWAPWLLVSLASLVGDIFGHFGTLGDSAAPFRDPAAPEST
jgi:hypothetical protein